MRICQLELRNFRGIRQGTVVLPTHTVLLGANNAGKTTLVEAIALLFGREKMISPVSDWDFHDGSPKPESRFYIIATLTDFPSNDPADVPDWFLGENVAQPVWWNDTDAKVHVEADPPQNARLATRVALAGRYDDEACDFETIRYFYYGESDPFTDGSILVPWRLLRDVGVFLLSSNRDWDKLLSFRSSSLLKVIREYDALPGKTIEDLKRQLRTDVAKIEDVAPLSEILDAATRELQSFLLISESSRMVYRPTSLDAVAVLQSLVAHVAKSKDILIPVARHGAGMVSLQAFLLLLAFAEHRKKSGRNFILAAEEPELHLHPSLHQRLVHRIRSASVQSIVTTQSPNVASGYQPSEVVFVQNTNGQFTATPLRSEPINAIPKNPVRNLYLRHRSAFYEALMGGVILVPEGIHDFDWLSLWQRLAQSSPNATDQYDLRPITILPTSDAAVVDSFQEIAKFRPDAIPIVDGDSAGKGYVTNLCSGTPIPAKVIRYGDDAATECLSAWILEPALTNPGEDLNNLLSGSSRTLRDLQKALCDTKKDPAFHEELVWESINVPGCCERACEFFRDVAAIAAGTLKSTNWQIQTGPSKASIYVASHIRRACS
ncbi:MAG TPA: AAA family ATPase [Dissulfurispiraceae bacterium]|nr:AAA family ATPase [Dissulfurispiraceae bacterium]